MVQNIYELFDKSNGYIRKYDKELTSITSFYE